MFKNRGSIEDARLELEKDTNNATAFIFHDYNEKGGKLSNVAISIKDNIATKNAPTQASSKLLEGFKPGYDATIVKKIKEAGGTIVGKVHLDELSLGGTGTYSAFGLISNRLDKNRMAGGSSSGSVATFTNKFGLAIGSDTGDSVRLPASYQGIVGYKPSYGAISRYGLFAFASSLDTIGYFTHNVNDTIIASQVLFGKDKMDMTSVDVDVPINQPIKPTRVAFLDLLGVVTENTQIAIDGLRERLMKDEIKVDLIRIDRKLLDSISTVYDVISYSEASSNDSNLTGWHFGNQVPGESFEDVVINTRTSKLGPMVQRRFALGSYFLLKDNQEEIFKKAQKVRRLIMEEFDEILYKYDLLIFPTQRIAPLIAKGKVGDWYTNILAAANLSGHPSITIPWITNDRMPVGLSLEARKFKDRKLLSHALWMEKFLKGGNDEK